MSLDKKQTPEVRLTGQENVEQPDFDHKIMTVQEAEDRTHSVRRNMLKEASSALRAQANQTLALALSLLR